MVSSAEDVILHKLVFFKQGSSDKHLRDIAGMLRVSGPEIDHLYIDHWALLLGVRDEWLMIKRRLDTLK